VSATEKLGPDDWRRVNEVFHRALEYPPDSRDAFVREACADNQRLCDEVASLLDAHDRAGSFIEPESEAARAAVEVSAADAASLVGRMLGHYRIESILGEGGMGVVYLAEDVRLGRTVALKAIAPRYTSDQARRDRLRREARAAAALSHPGIATVYALEELDGQIFIAGEYVPGETLRDELGRGPIAAARAIETAVCVARALAVAHDRGVVHRDLKPENLIRTPAGDVKILDFGLAHMRDVPPALARLTDDGTFLGTPAYMSPEQIRGDPVDGRSDLFSLGIVLYELVSGAHPFAGHDPASTIARILEADPPRLSQVGAGSGADLQMLGELEGIVRTCLRKAPGTRYQSAHELAGALDRMRDGTRPRSAIAPLPIDEPSSRSLARWWWQFHQGAVAGGYSLLMIALWMARGRIGGLPGRLLFLTGLMAVIGAITLRLHLWFTMRSYPSEWARQHANATGWIRLADAAFVAALLAGGLAVVEADGTLAAVLVGAGVGVLVSFTVIEPATTRAAFRDDGEA
jgi:serine/threonine protein kinase